MAKRRLWIMGMVVFACLMVSAVNAKTGRAESWHVEKWNMKKKYTVTKGGYRFHAYLSKNKKEAWVYYVETVSKAWGESYDYPEEDTASLGKQAPSKLHFPQKIQKAKITKIGADMTGEPKDELDFYQNVFGTWVEYAHGVDGYCNAVRNVKTMTLPKSLKELDESAFSGMRKLLKVNIPDGVKILENDTFYGCEKLRECKLPKSFSQVRYTCFEDCPRLANVTLSKENSNFVISNGMILSKDKKRLVWVAPGIKNVAIPATVHTIETDAFINSQVSVVHLGKNITDLKESCLTGKKLMNVTVEKGNPVYARDGQCIYRKSDGALAIGIARKKKLVISNRVKILPEKASLCGELLEDSDRKLEVLDISASVKEMHAFCPALSVFSRVYYRGTKPPKVTGGADGWSPLPIFCEVYVPKSALATYKKWYKSLGELDAIEKKDWHTF